MLIKEVIKRYEGKVEFVNEDWGESELAVRHGLKRYPVVFVNDILIARPADFGFLGLEGKYTPWNDPANHEKFKQDLAQIIDIILAGGGGVSSQVEETAATSPVPEILPSFVATDLTGKSHDSAKFSGRIVIMDFWAEWCSPCKKTLEWLNVVRKKHGDDVVVLAAAVRSDEKEVKKLVDTVKPDYPVFIGTEELGKLFGGIVAVPTLFVFDRQGKRAGIFYGAPEDLHENVGRLLDSLNK